MVYQRHNALIRLRMTTFHFDQSFRLTRKQGLKQGEYYSCDGKMGYLIVRFDDATLLFQEVSMAFWETLITSSDPEGYFFRI